MAGKDIIQVSAKPIVKRGDLAGALCALMARIRPDWQAKNLIVRVKRLLEVDPSSACQRLLNAAIHDLRSKIVIAGLDIAAEMAEENKLPTVQSQKDVENLSTSNALDLALHMGLLTNSEWRKLKRTYSIRKDLEHEDDEYEADVADCVYVFTSCINIVLSRDPVQMVRVTEVKELIERPEPIALCEELRADYESAPKTRQVKINKLLISVAMDDTKPEIVRENAFRVVNELRPLTRDPVKMEIARHLQEKTGRGEFTAIHMRVGHVSGIISYVKQKRVEDYFRALLTKLRQIRHSWRQHDKHAEPLGQLEDGGGFEHCPKKITPHLLKWCVLAFLGEPGGYGRGCGRPVFYSDTAAPIIKRIISSDSVKLRKRLEALAGDADVKRTMRNKHVARRYEMLLDLVDTDD